MCNLIDDSCSCRAGYYGSRCVQTCSANCVNKTCSAFDGSCACVERYYGERCESKCMNTCKDCFDGTQCRACPLGRYGPLCTIVCDCNGGPCNIVTGKSDGPSTCPSHGLCTACLTGLYGPKCGQQCSNMCTVLGCHQNGTCYQCKNTNIYGLGCNIQCSSLCINFTCDRWTGECPLQCSSLCETCDVSSGKCIKCRDPKQYGSNCQN